MKSVIARSVDEYFNAIVATTRLFGNDKPWWRGQADTDWKLVPSLYHKNRAQDECNMSIRFMNQAGTRHQVVPAPNDIVNWLFLMQHYGLPTRLLDWTQSPLIALYFAVTEDCWKEKNGTVWGLHPASLNAHNIGQNKIASTGHKEVLPLMSEAFDNKSKHDKDIAIAVLSKQIDLRQMIQMSEFTIHGSAKSLHEHTNAEKFLVSIVLPSDSKGYFRQALGLLGISEAYIYPDLEHLSTELQSLRYSADEDSKVSG